ncbi:tyrosine-type recombinase/integrase [Novosphingobium piscinae]|uniref:Tyrosine-type recombinase/integrase n=2 Tax=Novosphingobium piscinae TaxID=1507448 RepID=A0A7X1FXC6_9SPHN|nr:tyrosine-type recombinase/integrase [Novosphingobium piscinae]MBC2668734.1 tyrosine-type recombinase/integrase [Novosphingobium piscinae]
MARKRVGSNRFLPKYVSKFESQHGKVRYVFRRKGFKGGYFRSELGTEDFRAEYHAFMHPDQVEAPKPVPSKAKPGTIDDLVDRYFAVPERLGPSEVTQQKVRAVIEDFRTGRGDRPVSLVTFEAIDKIVAKKLVKTGTGNKTKGGIHAARKLRKELVRLFEFARKLKMLDHNPAADSEKVRVPVEQRTTGFHAWTEDEIQQFRQHWALGTKQRLAMELYLWTDQRRCDVYKMGRNQIEGGCIPVTQEKTGKLIWVPLAPQLLEAIVAMSPADTSPFCFIVSRKGTAYTKESFGNWFKDACVEAGLPHCNGHGLRKATLRRMAELQMSNKTMKSLSGQERDETLAGYIATADQKRLAAAAIRELAAWEKGLGGAENQAANAN